MKTLLLLLLSLVTTSAATLTNVPISGLPYTNQSPEEAYIPLIQPYVGRLTNDTFRTSISNLFSNRDHLYVTNLTVQNFYSTDNAGFSNLVVTNLTITTNFTFNTTVISNIIQFDLWTKSGSAYVPTLPQTSLFANGIGSGDLLSALGGFRIQPQSNPILLASWQDVDTTYKSYIMLSATNTDPAATDVSLGAQAPGGTVLYLENITDGQGFTIVNGTQCYDDPTLHIKVNGDYATTNKGDIIQFLRTTNGWAEIGRQYANTNVVSGNSLWELVGGHFRTLQPAGINDFQFRYDGVPQLTVSSNGGVAIGVNSLTLYGNPLTNGESLVSIRDAALGDPTYQLLHLESRNSSATEKGFLEWNAWPSGGILNLWSLSNGLSQAEINMQVDDGTASPSGLKGGYIQITSEPGMRTLLDPWLYWEAGTAYFFNTAYPVSGATNIVSIANAGTNLLTFGPLAQIGFGVGSSNVISSPENSYQFDVGFGGTNFFQFYRDDAAASYLVMTNSSNRGLTMSAGTNPRIEAYGQSLFLSSVNGVSFDRNGTPAWYVTSTGTDDILAASDGGASIGGTINNRPANVRVTTAVAAPKFILNQPTNTVFITSGVGDPNGVVTADIGSTYHRYDGGTGTSFYVKEANNGSPNGWVGK